MTRKILFRADGNSLSGLGHLYRLASLIEIVKNKFEYQFVTKYDSTLEAIPDNYDLHLIPQGIDIKKEPDWLAEKFHPKDYLIIIDGYQFSSEYQKELKKQGFNVIFIDDLATSHMFADVVINHSPYIDKSNFKKEAYTILALGTKYALLRPSFRKAAKRKRKVSKINRAFICFGGADPLDLTYKAVQALLHFDVFKEIHIVLGGAYAHKIIEDLKEQNPKKIMLYKNLSEKHLAKVMGSCNFGIVPASTILYELSCFKMPILSGFYVENQELIYKGFAEKSAIFKGGDFKKYTVKDFEVQIEQILKRNDFTKQIRAQESMIDGKIKSRHLKLIKNLCLN